MLNKHKHIEHLVDASVAKKTLINKTFLQTFLPTLLAITILFIAVLIYGGKPEKLPSWFNWMMFIIFTIAIGYSLVISQKRHLVGEYGETILILIPTFVWLLGGTFVAQEILLYVSVSIIGIGLLLAAFSWLPFEFHTKNRTKARNRSQLMLRLAFVCSSTAAMVVVSLILLNWADQTMHFAKAAEGHVSEHGDGSKDFQSSSWILFIAIVTVVSAAALVLIGLTHAGGEEAKHEEHAGQEHVESHEEVQSPSQQEIIKQQPKSVVKQEKNKKTKKPGA